MINSLLHKPTVLVLGSTGQTGRLIIEELNREPDSIHLRLSSRKREEAARLCADGQEAVYLDLDDPRSFGSALAGVERLYLLTGYTVDMLVQSKTLVDAARKAGVKHIVHQGIFGEWDCTDPHFAWHQLIERYIETSGITWTHLHPNYFMENLLSITPLQAGTFPMFCGDRRLGWIALRDLATVAATVLREGPEKHGGQNYWLSTEALNGSEVAAILSEVLDREIRAELQGPQDLQQLLALSGSKVESKYGEGAVEFMRQVLDGQMGYIGSIRNDVPYITGRAATTVHKWAEEHHQQLLEATDTN
jgi:NAD(P)H dehydrogenase (quinone)